MNAMREEFRYLESGQWAEEDPKECPCNGSGWLLSDLDTWHRCPTHGKGKPCPDDDHPEPEFDVEMEKVKLIRVLNGMADSLDDSDVPF